MRVLAQVAQLRPAGAGFEQGALAEATLKAAGRAGSGPGRGELTLPAAPTSRALPDEPFRLRIEAVGAESVGMPGVVGRAEQFTWGSGVRDRPRGDLRGRTGRSVSGWGPWSHLL